MHCIKLYSITQIKFYCKIHFTYGAQFELDLLCLYIQYGLHFQEKFILKGNNHIILDGIAVDTKYIAQDANNVPIVSIEGNIFLYPTK